MYNNNYELEYKTPMNDLPEHGEVVTEKPYYDTGSTPIPIPQEKNETKQSENTYNPIKTYDTDRYHQYYCEQ